jgi:ribosomal protein S18 acetylase RimI-like enzyme
MGVLEAWDVSLGGPDVVSVQCERAARGQAGLERLLVELDLQTFTETTLSPTTALVLAREGAVWLLRHAEWGDVIGAAACLRSWQAPHEAHLATISVLPGWRGRGLGVRFVGAILADLDREGVTALTLHVDARNARALAVYRELGFSMSEELRGDPARDSRPLELRCTLRDLNTRADGGAEAAEPSHGDASRAEVLAGRAGAPVAVPEHFGARPVLAR